ncbi:MAG: BrnT family toxin [Chromatiaceae bacterium]|nr:BrnT family toxin [Chromatiaceae bacterium]
MDFAWDTSKAESNIRKHGVSFDEARTVFSDPFELTISDPDHSHGEYRFLSIGRSERDRLLVVSYTERHPNTIRIISARVASRPERQIYDSRCQR